jgi:tRNA (mo5U34)-methyltransferase
VFSRFLGQASQTPLAARANDLLEAVQVKLSGGSHGDLEQWQRAIDRLPSLTPNRVDLNSDAVTVTGPPLSPSAMTEITEGLKRLHPWRKGPYDIHGVKVDAEWRSGLKWRRLAPHISSLRDRLVMDVGCGNGYYGWRMLGAGAKMVVGIDPTLLFIKQFEAIRRFIDGHYPLHLFPIGIESLPDSLALFDTVFSMGVFYHRRSPFDHLFELRDLLRPGGELVLETLVIAQGDLLVPRDRYAKMRNVWFIPSVPMLTGWLERAGFRDVRVVDVTATTPEEQRSTEWMRFESLKDYLDPDDNTLTVEGYPAPVRAMVIAEKP